MTKIIQIKQKNEKTNKKPQKNKQNVKPYKKIIKRENQQKYIITNCIINKCILYLTLRC